MSEDTWTESEEEEYDESEEDEEDGDEDEKSDEYSGAEDSPSEIGDALKRNKEGNSFPTEES